MKKILVLISISIMLVLSCGNEGKKNENTGKESKDNFKIGITQIVAHPEKASKMPLKNQV